jgi:hypothetical protein
MRRSRHNENQIVEMLKYDQGGSVAAETLAQTGSALQRSTKGARSKKEPAERATGKDRCSIPRRRGS